MQEELHTFNVGVLFSLNRHFLRCLTLQICFRIWAMTHLILTQTTDRRIRSLKASLLSLALSKLQLLFTDKQWSKEDFRMVMELTFHLRWTSFLGVLGV